MVKRGGKRHQTRRSQWRQIRVRAPGRCSGFALIRLAMQNKGPKIQYLAELHAPIPARFCMTSGTAGAGVALTPYQPDTA